MALQENTKAPEFTAKTEGGKEINLNDFKGKWVVLYFYPKDNTSGCTKEACSFRDNMSVITEKNAVVIGVSPDSIASHEKFIEKFNLNFNLISDTTKEICNLYDIMGEKSMYGKKYTGVIRTTYIIDDKGIIRKVYSKVKVDGHIEEVINDLVRLKH